MDCGGRDHRGHVRSRRSDVCCLVYRANHAPRGERFRTGVRRPGAPASSAEAGFFAASVLRIRRIFQMPKQTPATIKPTNTQSSGVDHFCKVPDQMPTTRRPYVTPSHATREYRRLRAAPKTAMKRPRETPSAPEASTNGDSGMGGGRMAGTKIARSP